LRPNLQLVPPGVFQISQRPTCTSPPLLRRIFPKLAEGGNQACCKQPETLQAEADGTREPRPRRQSRRVPSAGYVAGNTSIGGMGECVTHDVSTMCPRCYGAGHCGAPCHGTSRCERPSPRPDGSLRIRPASSRRFMAPLSAALETFAVFASRSSANLAGA
jgi:hypothetical protein